MKKGRICSVDGCGKKHQAKGFCRNHYESISRGESNRKHKKEYDQNHTKPEFDNDLVFTAKKLIGLIAITDELIADSSINIIREDSRLFHKEEKKKYSKRYWQKHREKLRNLTMLRRHGLSLEQIDQILIKQNHKCPICGKSLIETKRNIDHDHKTNIIRGILCDFCNVGIGYFHDDPKLLKKAIIYLHESQIPHLSGSCPKPSSRSRERISPKGHDIIAEYAL